MTPDQTQLVNQLHREVGHLSPGTSYAINAGHVVKLINFLRMEERRADVAEERLRKILTRAAEENLETLLVDPPAPWRAVWPAGGDACELIKDG